MGLMLLKPIGRTDQNQIFRRRTHEMTPPKKCIASVLLHILLTHYN